MIDSSLNLSQDAMNAIEGAEAHSTALQAESELTFVVPRLFCTRQSDGPSHGLGRQAARHQRGHV